MIDDGIRLIRARMRKKRAEIKAAEVEA